MVSMMKWLASSIRRAIPAGTSVAVTDAFVAAFDADYYALQLVAAGIAISTENPLCFYRSNAEARLMSPNPCFDETFYRSRYPDVDSAVRAGTFLSGFDHFTRHGVHEGRIPTWDFERQILNGIVSAELRDATQFDAASYLLQNEQARLFVGSMPMLAPLEFFNLYGRRMGHALCTIEGGNGNERADQGGASLGLHGDLISAEFDPDDYRAKHGDQLDGMAPLAHYLGIGRANGYSPNAQFDEMFYRTFYVDINRAVLQGKFKSGFEHYLVAGRKEGRLPKFELTKCLEQVLPGVTQPVAFAAYADLEDKLTPHPHTLVQGRPRMVWFFVPRMNPDIFFGGYTTLVRLAEAFLDQGFAIGFFLFEDHAESFDYFCHRCPASSLAQRCDEVAVFSALGDEPFPLGPDDLLIAYSAWQALTAGRYAEDLAGRRFAFLVQEYETIFHSYDSMRFLVDMAYKLPHVAIFNSTLLENFFREQRLGVFEASARSEDYLTFEHVLTHVTPPSPLMLRERKTRRFVVYARPEPHAARNLTEISLIALRRAIARKVFGKEFEFIGIGALSGPHVVPLGSGHMLQIKPKVDAASYTELLQGADIGLSLMYAPHPSLIPFELANAGAIVVTNTFVNRTSAEIAALSRRLVPVEPTIEAIVAGLEKAVEMVGDLDLRTNPVYAVKSPLSWQAVFDAVFIDNLTKKLSS